MIYYFGVRWVRYIKIPRKDLSFPLTFMALLSINMGGNCVFDMKVSTIPHVIHIAPNLQKKREYPFGYSLFYVYSSSVITTLILSFFEVILQS